MQAWVWLGSTGEGGAPLLRPARAELPREPGAHLSCRSCQCPRARPQCCPMGQFFLPLFQTHGGTLHGSADREPSETGAHRRRRSSGMLTTVKVQSGPIHFLLGGRTKDSVIQVQGSPETLPVAAPLQPSLRAGCSPLTRRLQNSPGGRRGRWEQNPRCVCSSSCLRVPSDGRRPLAIRGSTWAAMAGHTEASPRSCPHFTIYSLSEQESQGHPATPRHLQPCTSSIPASPDGAPVESGRARGPSSALTTPGPVAGWLSVSPDESTLIICLAS